MKKALDTIGAALGCEGTTTEKEMLEAIANIYLKVGNVAQGVKKKVQAKADKKLDKVNKELDEVKADLSKSWATISDLKTELEGLKEECKQMMDENGKTMKIAMGWREKYGDLKERCDEFPTENEMGLNVCDLDEIIKVQKDENATISEELEGLKRDQQECCCCCASLCDGHAMEVKDLKEELEKVKEIARRQSKWIVNAKKTIQIFEEVEEEKYCAKYCRCGTEWTKEKGDKYCKSCSGR